MTEFRKFGGPDGPGHRRDGGTVLVRLGIPGESDACRQGDHRQAAAERLEADLLVPIEDAEAALILGALDGVVGTNRRPCLRAATSPVEGVAEAPRVHAQRQVAHERLLSPAHEG